MLADIFIASCVDEMNCMDMVEKITSETWGSNYNAAEDKLKRWKCQPKEYINAERDRLTKRFHSIKSIYLVSFAKFQSRIVHMMNPGCIQASALWIPPVSTDDEITNIEFSLDIVKILEMIELVVVKKDKINQASLLFPEDYSNKTVFFVQMD